MTTPRARSRDKTGASRELSRNVHSFIQRWREDRDQSNRSAPSQKPEFSPEAGQLQWRPDNTPTIEQIRAIELVGRTGRSDNTDITVDALIDLERGRSHDARLGQPLPGRQQRTLGVQDFTASLKQRLLDTGEFATGHLNKENVPDPKTVRPHASPYIAYQDDGYGVAPFPSAADGYTVLPEHAAYAHGYLSETYRGEIDRPKFTASDTGDFVPFSSQMTEERKEELGRAQVHTSLQQPAAKQFLSSLQLKGVITPKDVGPPDLKTIQETPDDRLQGKVPEIHYVITDLADRANQQEGDEKKATIQRMGQWATQGKRITDNYNWYVDIAGDKDGNAADYYQELINAAENPQADGKQVPVLELAPHKLTNKGGVTQQRHLKQLGPPPSKASPEIEQLPPNVDNMDKLAAHIRRRYAYFADRKIKTPITEQEAIDLYTKQLPKMGEQQYISNITTPWYTIDEGQIMFTPAHGGFREILRKAGEWWPIEIGWKVKEIHRDQAQAIEDGLRHKYEIRAVEHFASNSGVQTSMLSIPGTDRFGTSAGLPWIAGYDTGDKPRSAGALNKRLLAGTGGDFTAGQYYAEDHFEGDRQSITDPQQPHKSIMLGTIMLGTGEEKGKNRSSKDNKPETLKWRTENTTLPAIDEHGKWDEGMEANAGMGRIKESAFRRWLAAGTLKPSTARSLADHEVRAFQIWHIDNEGPYKGMLEVIPDAKWRDGDTDIIMSADMIKNDVKFQNASVTRGTLKFVKEPDPYVRIGFLQQIANLIPIVGQASATKALRHAADEMSDNEIQAVFYEQNQPREFNSDERPVAAALINILRERGGSYGNLGLQVTGSPLSSTETAQAEMTAFKKFKSALTERDIGSVYMPGMRIYFKHWKMAGLAQEPAPDHITLQWSKNPKGSGLPDVPTGFVSREVEHSAITDATDGSDLDDELIILPGYRRNSEGERRPAVIIIRDPASPGNNAIKYISDGDADKIQEYFGSSMYWHEINGKARQYTSISGQKIDIVDMPKAITEGPLVTDVEWQPELDHGMPRKKSQMWAQSQMAGYVGALASAIYTLDAAGLFDPKKHNLTASDAIDAIAKGTGDPRRMIFMLSDSLLKAVHEKKPMPKDGMERIKGWLTPMYNARYGTNLTPAELVERVPDQLPYYRRDIQKRAHDLASRIERGQQVVEWMSNGSPHLLTEPNQTTPELRREAQAALNEVSYLHNYQVPAIKSEAQKRLGRELNQIEQQDLDDKVGAWANEKERHIGRQYYANALRAMRQTELNDDGTSAKGRAPGDIAIALIQAQMARKTESGHGINTYGKINISNMVKSLGGMEQIALYERMIEKGEGEITGTTTLPLKQDQLTKIGEDGKKEPSMEPESRWRVMRHGSTGPISLVSEDGKTTVPIGDPSTTKDDGNAEKLLGTIITYEGNLQTDGLPEGRNRIETGVFSIDDPISLTLSATKLNWDRPEKSFGGEYDQPESPAAEGEPLRQKIEDDADRDTRIERQQRDLRLINEKERRNNPSLQPTWDFGRYLKESLDDRALRNERHRRETQDEEDPYMDRPPEQTAPEFIGENITSLKGVQNNGWTMVVGSPAAVINQLNTASDGPPPTPTNPIPDPDQVVEAEQQARLQQAGWTTARRPAPTPPAPPNQQAHTKPMPLKTPRRPGRPSYTKTSKGKPIMAG